MLLVGGFLGAAGQRLLAKIFEPIHFCSRLLQLTLLRPVIGEQTYNEVLRELTMRYFLGEQHKGLDARDEREGTRVPAEAREERIDKACLLWPPRVHVQGSLTNVSAFKSSPSVVTVIVPRPPVVRTRAPAPRQRASTSACEWP